MAPAQRALGRLLGTMERRDAGHHALRGDPAPSPILQNFTTAMRHKARILRPMVRKAWLDKSKPGERTFDQKFVACPWDEVLDLLASELSRIEPNMAPPRSSAAPMAGPAPDVSTTRRARFTAS